MQKHKIVGEQLICATKAGVLLDLEVEHGITGEHVFYTIAKHPDWVNVIAETKDHKIILVEQWRAGIDAMSIEVPGGKIDLNEEPIEAALRELSEETGYTVSGESKISYLGSVDANPAIQDNKMHYVYVSNVEKTKDTNFDEGELVYTKVCHREKVSEMLTNGSINHAYSVLALYKTFKG